MFKLTSPPNNKIHLTYTIQTDTFNLKYLKQNTKPKTVRCERKTKNTVSYIAWVGTIFTGNGDKKINIYTFQYELLLSPLH